MPREKIHLLIIDPQRGFAQEIGDQSNPAAAYKEQQELMDGELCVPGGMQALNNVAELINNHGPDIVDITCTFDCHQELHIAHGVWFRWVTKPDSQFIQIDGQDRPTYEEAIILRAKVFIPPPFSTIVEKDGRMLCGYLDGTGQFVPIGDVQCMHLGFTKWTTDYLRKLREGDRYPHMIWPRHCRIGTRSNNWVTSIRKAIIGWERNEFAVASKITKGSNMKTEHFGAVHAEVVDPNDPTTQVNTHFVELLSNPDHQIVLCGLARGHCLANTGRDVMKQFPNPYDFLSRLTLLTDGTADVPNLEFLGEAFVTEMTATGPNGEPGMKLATCGDLAGIAV